MAAAVATVVAFGVGYGVAASAIEPKIVTETVTKTRTVYQPPVIKVKKQYVPVVKWRTKTVTKYVTAPTDSRSGKYGPLKSPCDPYWDAGNIPAWDACIEDERTRLSQ